MSGALCKPIADSSANHRHQCLWCGGPVDEDEEAATLATVVIAHVDCIGWGSMPATSRARHLRSGGRIRSG